MSEKKLFFIGMTASLMMVWATQAVGQQSSAVVNEAAYATLIDRYAACCECKSKFRKSRSANLRQKAEVSCLKATYLRNYKAKIIQKLIEEKAQPDMYKIQYISNSMFYDLIRQETASIKGVANPANLTVVE